MCSKTVRGSSTVGCDIAIECRSGSYSQQVNVRRTECGVVIYLKITSQCKRYTRKITCEGRRYQCLVRQCLRSSQGDESISSTRIGEDKCPSCASRDLSSRESNLFRTIRCVGDVKGSIIDSNR